LAVALALNCFIAAASAQAIGASVADDMLGLLSPKPMAERSLNDRPSREYTGIPFEGWMLYPNFLVAATYDDNLFQTSTNRVAAAGVNLHPTFLADRDAGLHHTILYLDGDINLYPGEPTGNTVNARTGFAQVWKAERDLTFRINGEYARRSDLYNNGSVISPSTAQVLGLQTGPQRSNVFTGSASGLKSFDRLFVGLAGTVVETTYDTLYTMGGPVSESYRNNVAYSVDGRLGYKITPVIYAFSQVTGNTRVVDDSLYNSQGYRIVGGLGSDRISLFQGEIYAGYQRQIFDAAQFGSPGNPVYGGKISWFPTRAWIVSASLDETYQDASSATVGNPLGSAAYVTSALVNINYAMSRSWNASVQGGYEDLSYISGGRRDHRWTTGATLTYEILRNFNVTFKYSFATIESNAPGGSFTRNQLTLGGAYKY
jgi:hypothetical protein